jgi:hypothetical protein
MIFTSLAFDFTVIFSICPMGFSIRFCFLTRLFKRVFFLYSFFYTNGPLRRCASGAGPCNFCGWGITQPRAFAKGDPCNSRGPFCSCATQGALATQGARSKSKGLCPWLFTHCGKQEVAYGRYEGSNWRPPVGTTEATGGL